jgi:multidrug efflux pump subunit AcrA (membrane-fusion protein)
VAYVLGSYKACVISNGVAEVREVKLGDRFGQDVEIVEGLREGESVAATGIARLDTGTRVRVVAEAANAHAPAE